MEIFLSDWHFLAFFIVLLSAPKYMYDGKYLIPGLIMGYMIMPHLHSSIGHYVKKKGFIYEKFYIVFTCLILIIFLRSGYNSGKKVLEYGLPDTRVLMADWLNQNTNQDDKIILQDDVTDNYRKMGLKHGVRFDLFQSIINRLEGTSKDSYNESDFEFWLNKI